MRRATPPRSRRGISLMEVAVAVGMLAVALAVTLQALGWVAADRRAAGRRQRALAEASNALERLASRPWGELTPEALKSAALPPEAADALPGGELRAEVAEGDAGLKRLRVEVRWRGRGADEAPVRLTTWVARRPGGTR